MRSRMSITRLWHSSISAVTRYPTLRKGFWSLPVAADHEHATGGSTVYLEKKRECNHTNTSHAPANQFSRPTAPPTQVFSHWPSKCYPLITKTARKRLFYSAPFSKHIWSFPKIGFNHLYFYYYIQILMQPGDFPFNTNTVILWSYKYHNFYPFVGTVNALQHS